MSLWDLGVAEGGVAVAIVLGIALHSAFPNAAKPQIARNCFWAAWAIFAGFAVMWGISTDESSLLQRGLIVGFLSAVVVLSQPGSLCIRKTQSKIQSLCLHPSLKVKAGKAATQR